MAPSRSKSFIQNKRKQDQEPVLDATPSGKQQFTISQLFGSSDHERRSKKEELSPSSKRRKLIQEATTQTIAILGSKPASVDNMYSFASTGPTNVVDLTKPSNGKGRRISGGTRLDHFSSQAGPRKLVVKNLRTTTKTDPNQYCEQTIGGLESALTSIFKDERPALSNEELYRGAENLCKLGKALDLSKMLMERCKAHVSLNIASSLASVADGNNVPALKAVLAAWSKWMKQLIVVRQIFTFLDRSYLMQVGSPSIYETAVGYFRKYIFGNASLRPKIIDGACDLLQADRTGDKSAQALFSESVKMFHDLAVYTNDFEPRMLHLSQDYIVAWSDKECTEKELPDYVESATALIETEMARCSAYDLDATTRRALLTLLEHHIVERRESYLVSEDPVADLLDLDATENLQKLYTLLQRRRLGAKLKTPFSKWIDLTGTAIVFDEKEQDKMVLKLLDMKRKLDNMWRISFGKNEEIGHALRESFETFINKSKKTSATWGTDNSKPGEMIAKYVDILLRAGAKAIPIEVASKERRESTARRESTIRRSSIATAVIKEATAEDEDVEDNDFDEDKEVNYQLEQVLDLFRFVHGKAVFEAFYKKDLARRLLMGRSASADAERNMLVRLKKECGEGFTGNLEQMFKDIELAREEMGSYKSRMQQNDRKQDIDLSVNILSAAAWPTYPDVPVIIPPQIKASIDSFQAHYSSKHSGRKLQWKHALAHCQMKANFPKGNKEFVVSSFQAVVLLLFNGLAKDAHLTYEHIKSESGLPEAEVKRTLQSLACAKLRPLTKNPKGKDINDDDTFTINESFSNEKYRIKINAIQLKETKEENKETHERVAADRQFETQAAIVRIMKGAKTMTHSQLVAEVIKATQTRGVLAVPDIKKNIDKLIEKEYLERNTETGAYDYVS